MELAEPQVRDQLAISQHPSTATQPAIFHYRSRSQVGMSEFYVFIEILGPRAWAYMGPTPRQEPHYIRQGPFYSVEGQNPASHFKEKSYDFFMER